MIVQLIETLRILAETSDNQKKYLIDLGTFPSTDELALEFDCFYPAVMANLKEPEYQSLFNGEVVENLRKLDALFDRMSSIPNNTFWETDSLDGTEWSNVRKIARHTLSLISKNTH